MSRGAHEQVQGAAEPTIGLGEPPTSFLEVRDLRIQFPTDDGVVKAVDGVSFRLERGTTLGIVGESGSGKSVTSLGILGLHNARSTRMSGQIWLNGRELVSASAEQVRQLRGKNMAMIFQDPLSSLHPFYTIGKQIVEAYRVHNHVSGSVARKHAIDMLGRVGIPRPESRVDDYPHQFSGGMRQRAMIAMALCCDPELLIADEPTTALDVTVQAQILDLIADLQREFNSAVIIITHDLGVVAEVADDILVMYAGRPVEYASTVDIFGRPQHPYTWGLLSSMPRLDKDRQDRLVPIPGTPPSLINVPQGCAFNPRCAYGHLNKGRSETERPLLVETEPGHQVACHLSNAQQRQIWLEDIAPRL
ncbi:MAG: peptide/nickel transport system ATP-binding protein [Actinomycetota bacterium]|jgi:peptide/nickel transport system ATP-binding protein|nr:peptide/nickel transport system ATP-binding protein [Actinomycetota bacterium]